MKKLGIGIAIIAAIGGSYWFLIDHLLGQAGDIRQLKSEKAQMTQSLSDAQKATKKAREEMELWEGLYATLQTDFATLQENRDAMSAEMAQLREEQDVQDYLACPMPDDLYDWVRKN